MFPQKELFNRLSINRTNLSTIASDLALVRKKYVNDLRNKNSNGCIYYLLHQCSNTRHILKE